MILYFCLIICFCYNVLLFRVLNVLLGWFDSRNMFNNNLKFSCFIAQKKGK